MKVIIAGSRDITNYKMLEAAIKRSKFKITEVVSGHARGGDRLGERYARLNDIPVKLFKADWILQGKNAGYKRNVDMARYADALIALWDGKSRGTGHMINIAKHYKLKIYIHKVKGK